MALQEEYVDINLVPTHIMTWGQTINETFSEETKEIVVVIPGNPGKFYMTLKLISLTLS